MDSAVDICACGPGFAIGRWRNVVIVLFETTPTTKAAAQMEAIAADAAAEHQGGMALLHVVDASHGAPPGAAARSHYRAMIRDRGQDMRCAAIVAAGSGFVPSIVRSVVAGLTIATRPRFPTKTFAATEPATVWVAEIIGVDAAQLLAAVVTTKAAIER